MGLTKFKLGTLLTLCDDRNVDLNYGIDDVKGISIKKMFIETKAEMTGVSLRPYIIVAPDSFAYVTVTSRNGEKITLAHNNTNNTYIVSSSYIVFKLKRKDLLDSKYLFMYFNRPEFDRYARFNSWGSARETFSWEDLCDIDIDLPPIHIQQKYVDIYNAMVANQQCYERGLKDLNLAIDGIIEKFKNVTRRRVLGDLVVESDERNTDDAIQLVNGVNKDKRFMPSVANGADLTKYKLVQYNQFACNLMHVGRDVAVPVALNAKDDPIIVSPAYIVFNTKDETLLPEFLLMWLSRTETDRYAWFICDSSVRSGMEKKRFYEIEIPVPTKTEQEAIVNLYSAYTIRRSINERLKAQIKDICPILVKGAVEEGGQV